MLADAILITIWVLIGSGGLLISATILSLQWFPAGLLRGGYNPVATRLLAGRLAAALRQGAPLSTALNSCQLHIDAGSAQRLQAFQLALEDHHDVATAVTFSRLLPPPQQSLFAQIPSNKPNLLARALERYAAESPLTCHSRSALGMVLGLLPILFIVWSFVVAVIIPKFEYIFIEMAIELPLVTTWLVHFSRLLDHLGLLGLGLVVFMALALLWLPTALRWWWHAWQPGSRRLQRGYLLLDGAALGLPESHLASLIGYRQPHPTMADLCHACGITAHTSHGLAAALMAGEQRRLYWAQLLEAALAIAIWLVVGVLTGAVVLAMFLPLVEILHAID